MQRQTPEATPRVLSPGEHPATHVVLHGDFGPGPSWEDRQRAMLDRCRSLEAFERRWHRNGTGVRRWQERARATAAFSE